MNTDITMAAGPILPVSAARPAIRLATAGDLAFIDGLQKKQSKQVGWMPAKQLEEYVQRGQVLLAESEMGDGRGEMGDVQTAGAGRGDPDRDSGISISHLPSPISHRPTPVGYCISRDQYMKRDDVGIVYQLNVVPERRRSLVGAMLIQAVFERAAYGCRLFCCWCAQDIEANRFWESLGFVPLAFRAGSRGKRRVHIFWQRRVRAGDETTPYWYPAQTSSGAIREDRLVFPIPPGTHWSDEMPRVLPDCGLRNSDCGLNDRAIEASASRSRTTAIERSAIARSPIRNPKSELLNPLQAPPAGMAAILVGGRIKYVARKHYAPTHEAIAPPAEPAPPKRVREKRPAARHDRTLVAAARELRDRWLEQVNGDPSAGRVRGKYDVGRGAGGEGMLAGPGERRAALPLDSLPPLLPAA